MGGTYHFDNVGRGFNPDLIDRLIDSGADSTAALGNEGAAAFNLNMALSSWMDSLNAGARNHIIIDGDSNAAYSDSSPFKWAQQLRGDLITLTGLADGGPGFVRADQFTQISGTNGTNNSSAALDGYRRGPHGSVIGMSGAGAPTFSWTKPTNFGPHNRFALYAWDDDFLAGQGEYQLNGGAWTATAFNYAGPVGFVNQEIVGSVTTLGVRTTSGFWAFEGAALYQGTTGLVVHNVASGGTAIDDISGPAGRHVSLWDHIQPALTIFWTGTNELHYNPALSAFQLPLDDFYDYYTLAVSKARQYGDVLMIFPQATPTNVLSEPADIAIKQVEYQRIARLVAWEQDAGFLSIAQAFGSPARAISRGYMASGGADPHHLSEAGHEAVHRIITRAIERNS